MESIRQVQKKYCSKALATAITAAFVLLLAGQNAIAKGLVLGTLFSVVNFVLMGQTLPLRLGKSQRQAFFWSLASLLLRYAFVAVPVIVAVKLSQFNLFAVIAGIFAVQAVILTESVLTTFGSIRNKQA